MRPVLVTQRVDVYPDRNERRDALDQKLVAFLAACGCLAIPAPNAPDLAAPLFRLVKPHGVILSGGNDLADLGGNAPERDATEAALVDAAAAGAVPVVGICRGMQFLVHRSGGTLEKIPGHVATRHALTLPAREVNSFHNWAVVKCGADWSAVAFAPDGSVEHARCPSLRQTAIMWHPEREREFAAEDIGLFREALGIAG